LNTKIIKWMAVALPYAVGLTALWYLNTNFSNFAVGYIALAAPWLGLAITLNLEAGYAGIPNFGKLLFMTGGVAFSASAGSFLSLYLLKVSVTTSPPCPPFATGYYNCQEAAVSNVVNPTLGHNLPLALGIALFMLLVGGAAGAILGYLMSYPAIRLREDYLGMLLLATSQFFPVLIGSTDPFDTAIFNGQNGLRVPDPFASIAGPSRLLVAALVFAFLVLLIYLYAERVARSPLGRMLRAIRDDENAAEALGKDTVRERRKILMIASALSGVTGAYFGISGGAFDVTQWAGSAGRTEWTFFPWVMMVMGGAANNLGVAFGALTFSFILAMVDQVKTSVGLISLPILNFGTPAVLLEVAMVLGIPLGGVRVLKKTGRKATTRRKAVLLILAVAATVMFAVYAAAYPFPGFGSPSNGLITWIEIALILGIPMGGNRALKRVGKRGGPWNALLATCGLVAGVGFYYLGGIMNLTSGLISQTVKTESSYLEYIFFGTMLIAILLLRPEGIFPEKPTATLSKGKLESVMRTTRRVATASTKSPSEE